MDYKRFLALPEKPTGKTSSDDRGPLLFGAPEEMLEIIADWSVMDDFMSEEGMSNWVEDYPTKFPTYAPLAIPDAALLTEDDPDYYFDSNDEWFLAVDTAHPAQRVMLWTGTHFFEEMFPSFEAFWASLEDWGDDGDDDADDDDDDED